MAGVSSRPAPGYVCPSGCGASAELDDGLACRAGMRRRSNTPSGGAAAGAAAGDGLVAGVLRKLTGLALRNPQALQPLRRLATAAAAEVGEGGAPSRRVSAGQFRRTMAETSLRLGAEQLDRLTGAMVDATAALDRFGDGRGGGGAEEGGVSFDVVVEACFLGKVEALRRQFRSACFRSGESVGSSSFFFDSDSDDGGDDGDGGASQATLTFERFRHASRRAGLTATAMSDAELRQLFEWVDAQGAARHGRRRGALDEASLERALASGVSASLLDSGSAVPPLARLLEPTLARLREVAEQAGGGRALLERLGEEVASGGGVDQHLPEAERPLPAGWTRAYSRSDGKP
jgi:hypothetical protein